MNLRFFNLAFIAACGLWSVLPLRGENLRAVRIEGGLKLDGFLSDEAWKSVPAFADFRMIEPYAGRDPSEKTELRIVFDEDSLYIGVYCFDADPSKISANTMAHDDDGDDGRGGDIIKVLLDPFQDKRNAYIFFVNPRGGRCEGLAFGEHSSLNWDGIWDARARILPDGWSAELKIPFKTISFKPGLASWGLNVERYIARKQETIRLSGTTQDSFFYNPMEAAALGGVQGIEQGKGITFRPYGLAGMDKNHVLSSNIRGHTDGGFDIYKNFTPNFVGAFSYNTDFAETEVDERRINLTRFALRFPEKRTFFLEGSEIFNFGVESEENFSPFFSRRIGLYGGRQVPVAFGTKLFGKVGNTNVSVLDVKTDRFEDLPGRNYFAARLSQNIFSESKVGVIFTSGSPSGERNTLAGLDFIYSTSKFRGNKNFLAGAWWVHNWNELKTGRHRGYGFKVDYPNDLWDVALTYANYGDSLDPGLGFLPRNATQRFTWGVNYMPRPERGILGTLVRQFFFEFRGNFYWDLGGRLETRTLFWAPLNLSTESGEHIEFNLTANRDVLPGDFEVADGVILAAKAYNFTNYGIEIGSADHRPVVFNLEYSFGDFYSGKYDNFELGAMLKYKGYATLEASTEFVRGRLPEGRFRENVYQVKADFFFSPRLGVMNYFQYDDVSKKLGWSTRLRWQVSPGNEIYLVYTKNWERRWDPARRFRPLEERGVLKLQFSIRP